MQLAEPQYHVRIGSTIYGPVPLSGLRKLPGFTLQSPIRTLKGVDWKPAFEAVDLEAYFRPPAPAARSEVQNNFNWSTAFDSAYGKAQRRLRWRQWLRHAALLVALTAAPLTAVVYWPDIKGAVPHVVQMARDLGRKDPREGLRRVRREWQQLGRRAERLGGFFLSLL